MSWDTAGAGGDSFAEPASNNHGGVDAYGGSYGGEDEGVAGTGGGAGFGGDCYNCGETGHSKAECPNPVKQRDCYNCGEPGHTKAECTNPTVAREFSGTCRLCEQVGHRASDCPSAPSKPCNNCQQDGHAAFECKNPRKMSFEGVPDIPAEAAWEEMKVASEERDLDDFKEAFMKYRKATPDATYAQLETAFRGQGFSVYLIAIEKELQPTYTNIDLQGNLEKKYTVSFRLSDKHQRPKEKELWPSSPEENMDRLEDAGEPYDRGVPLCSNCSALGHSSKGCPEDKMENARSKVTCFNCNEDGHRVRDCPQARPDKFACRNCKQSGHSSKECTEPRSAEGVECKNCNEVGHFSKDCPTRIKFTCRNCGSEEHKAKDCTEERKLICRNCDEEGHTGKECKKPRDYSRVKCSNCQQMGHTKVRCKEPIVEEDAEHDGGGGGANAYGDENAGGGDYGNPAPEYSGGGDNFPASAPAPAADDGWGGGGSGGGGW